MHNLGYPLVPLVPLAPLVLFLKKNKRKNKEKEAKASKVEPKEIPAFLMQDVNASDLIVLKVRIYSNLRTRHREAPGWCVSIN